MTIFFSKNHNNRPTAGGFVSRPTWPPAAETTPSGLSVERLVLWNVCSTCRLNETVFKQNSYKFLIKLTPWQSPGRALVYAVERKLPYLNSLQFFYH